MENLMALIINNYVNGPVQTNNYFVFDKETKEAVIIDAAVGSQTILAEADKAGIKIKALWITHAHFDHMDGCKEIIDNALYPIEICLHKDAVQLWHQLGGGPLFGIDVPPQPEPNRLLSHGDELQLGHHTVKVLHTPGHTQGHVTYYFINEGAAFCGDLIFKGSVGRTDLPESNHNTLIDSIQTQILTLPDQTRLYPGHGPETSVENERNENPFISHSSRI
jgi:glyoxylase-like metal-dependent hydrolase (beta-lactamase superfamily II)